VVSRAELLRLGASRAASGCVRPAHSPEINVPLTALDHRRLDPDFYWPANRLVAETDGWETHRTKAAFKDDRRRDAALVASGYRVLRFTHDDVVYEGAA
jgi:Protein of unknown function (DUF559)